MGALCLPSVHPAGQLAAISLPFGCTAGSPRVSPSALFTRLASPLRDGPGGYDHACSEERSAQPCARHDQHSRPPMRTAAVFGAEHPREIAPPALEAPCELGAGRSARDALTVRAPAVILLEPPLVERDALGLAARGAAVRLAVRAASSAQPLRSPALLAAPVGIAPHFSSRRHRTSSKPFTSLFSAS